MTLAQEDINYIKIHLPEWLKEVAPHLQFERELYERVVHVEKELVHQRELMQQIQQQMDTRFEQMLDQMNRRFEQTDKRFDQMNDQMNRRFDQMNDQMNRRFEQVDRHFTEVTRRIDRFMIWSLGLTLTAAGLVIAVLRLWPPAF